MMLRYEKSSTLGQLETTRFEAYLRVVGPVLVTLGGATLAAACSPNLNYEERERYAETLDQPEAPCIASCLPTPDPDPVDCGAAERGYEFLSLIDFEGAAIQTYVYDDRTPDFRLPTQGWEPPSTDAQRCKDGDDGNQAIHLMGGPFLSFGGGMGYALHNAPSELEESEEYGVTARDISDWEGIAFWARRGVEGQSGLRVMLADKYTDDDLSYMAMYNRLVEPSDDSMPRPTELHCRRFLVCNCPLGVPCTYYPGESENDPAAGEYCYDPKVDPDPADAIGAQQGLDASDVVYERCGEFQCNFRYPSFEGRPGYEDGRDPEFENKPCTAYTLASGQFGKFCFDPEKDQPPPEAEERCGDNWYATVLVTEEWRFFRVPFNEMLQQGFAKESFFLDLENASLVRFSWDRGWLDHWIDDVKLYRRARD